ncbi:MAG: transcriptional repressor [Bdellovibrionales bacterium CG10_big_fil_rev_8_21_14_0_10_45_34]|nr:MAG: transcriptional repressor [Bdellovibrionales bacterium CG10_big_fil_rev_8_21_14_0_10_45_34]
MKLAHRKLDINYFKSIVRDLGLKVTHQRLLILENILKGREHITAQEVFENVIERSPEVGFATVYRFLRTLTEAGYLTEVRMKGLPARYEWAHKEHHHHLTCTKCGRIYEFENQLIEDIQDRVAQSFNFLLTDHVFELWGLCHECQPRATDGASDFVKLPKPQIAAV